MKKLTRYCDKCRFLNVTEEEQNKIKLNDNQLTKHYCLLFNQMLFHKDYHPKIPRIEECFRLSNTNFEFKMFDDENIYGIILSKKAEKILKDIAKYQKSTYTEVIEKLILAEGRLISHCLKDMEKKQYKTDSTNTFIAEEHYLNMSRNNGKSNKILEDNLNKIKRKDQAYEYAYELFISYYYLTEKYDREIAIQKKYDAKGFIVLNNKEMILSSKFATNLHNKLYKKYILAFPKANEFFEKARQKVIYMTFKTIAEEYQRLYGKDDENEK